MTKKDYERAALIVQRVETPADLPFHHFNTVQGSVEDAFVQLFRDDNPCFDEARFRAACVPGANVKARKVTA